MSARPLLALLIVLLAGPAAAEEAGPTTVVLVDISPTAGAASAVLEDAAGRIRSRAGVPATVTGPLDDAAGNGSSAPRRTEALDLLNQAQAQYEAFDLDAARATLERASLTLDALTDPEVAELKLQLHWLQAQIAIVLGDSERASSHVRIIARVAPWWEPPVGFLTPEVKKALVDERARIEADGVHVLADGLPPNTVVRIDGLAVEGRTEIAVPAGRHVLRTERPGYRAVASVQDLGPGETVRVAAPVLPVWSEGQRSSLRTALENQDDGDRSPLLDETARATGAALIAVALDDGSGRVRARLYSGDPAGWVAPPGQTTAEGLATVVASELPRLTPTTPRGPVQPLLAFEIGGGGRLVGPSHTAVAAGGGLAASFGGGIAVRQFLGVRALLAAGVHGPSPLPIDTGDAGLDGTQQGFLIRAGVEVAPRIPLGRGSFLWFAGGGGFAVGGVATDLDGAEPATLLATGGYVAGSLGVEHSPRPGFCVGPVVGFTYAGIGVDDSLVGAGGTLRVSASSYSVLEVGLRVAVRPPG